jgi:drug/metabolite transporter (DMT)-like permease
VTSVLTFAIGANICFGVSSIFFTTFSKRFSPFWMNQVKVSVALFAFVAASFAADQWVNVSVPSVASFMFSGFIGLCIGDLFLFRSFTLLGPARTLMLFSFQPIFLGSYGYLMLGQGFSLRQLLAIACMIACLITFLRERVKNTGKMDLSAFAFAFIGISLDSVGVMFTRNGYELTPELQSFPANAIRCIGAILGFILLKPTSYKFLMGDIKKLSLESRVQVIGASLLGTFISLSLYLAAIKSAHLGSLSAVAITGPVLIATIDCIRERRRPPRPLLVALGLFSLGVLLMSETI